MTLAGEHCPRVMLEPSQPNAGRERPLEGVGHPMIGELGLVSWQTETGVESTLYLIWVLYDEDRELTSRYTLDSPYCDLNGEYERIYHIFEKTG